MPPFCYSGLLFFHFFTTANVRVPVQVAAAYLVRAGTRLLTRACNQRASASSCKAGGSPAAQRREEAQGAKLRRLAARQPRGCHSSGAPKRPEQRGARRQGRWLRGLVRGVEGMSRLNSLQRPPVARPKTTRRQRRARSSSGYVCRRLRCATRASETPACASAAGCGEPSRVSGETGVASTAS